MQIPLEIINKILILRPTHINALLIDKYCKDFSNFSHEPDENFFDFIKIEIENENDCIRYLRENKELDENLNNYSTEEIEEMRRIIYLRWNPN